MKLFYSENSNSYTTLGKYGNKQNKGKNHRDKYMGDLWEWLTDKRQGQDLSVESRLLSGS